MGRASHLLDQVVTYATPSGYNAAGDPTWGAQSTANARIENKRRLIRSTTGDERQTDTVVITETEIPITAAIWLPGDDTSSQNEARQIHGTNKAKIPGENYWLYEAML